MTNKNYNEFVFEDDLALKGNMSGHNKTIVDNHLIVLFFFFRCFLSETDWMEMPHGQGDHY